MSLAGDACAECRMQVEALNITRSKLAPSASRISTATYGKISRRPYFFLNVAYL